MSYLYEFYSTQEAVIVKEKANFDGIKGWWSDDWSFKLKSGIKKFENELIKIRDEYRANHPEEDFIWYKEKI